MRAGDHVLEAWSLAELAELIHCALRADDAITWVRATGGRPLTDGEFTTLLKELGA